MYYFKRQAKETIKYKIVFDKNKVEELKREVIDNCSHITHHEFDGENVTGMMAAGRDPLKIRNFRRGEKVGVHEYIDGPDEDVYHYSYDEYKFPEEIKLFDGLLLGDISVIDRIFSIKDNNYKKNLDKQIKKISAELDEIDNLDIHNKKKKLNELEKVLKEAHLNKDKRLIDKYMEELRKLITFRQVAALDNDIIDKVDNFYRVSAKQVKKRVKEKN